MNIPLFYAYRSEKVEEVCLEVLRSGFIATGPYVQLFTNSFAELIKNPNVVTTNDVSNSVQIALHLAGVREGDEVLTTAFSCMSSNSSIATIKAKAVWVDIDPQTSAIDLDSLRKAITPKSKALILYHVAGYPAEIEEVAKICKENGIILIEDCNNALLATYDGKQVGQWGDFSVFSFYPNRQINAGEGGALICRKKSDAERAIRLRRYGIDSNTFRDSFGEISPASDIPEVGWGATLNNLCSAMGHVQVNSVPERLRKTRENVIKFNDFLETKKTINPIKKLEKAYPSYWVYMIRSQNRDALMQNLKKAGINCSKIHQLNTLYSGFKVPVTNLPGSEEFMKTILGIPCGWWLTKEQLEYIQMNLDEKV